MAGQFLTKEEVAFHADRLGLNIEGMRWQQKLATVMQALKNEGNDIVPTHVGIGITPPKEEEDIDMIPSEEVLVEVKSDPMDAMRGKVVMIAPEMAQTEKQCFGYEEELDYDLDVDEVHHNIDDAYMAGKDLIASTYNIIGTKNKKVVAHTALPKEGAGITFSPEKDIVPVVTFQGRSGYLWTHHRLPNIKQLLIASGYYFEYKDQFKDEPFIWHAAGKLLVCDRILAESVLREIEIKERERRAIKKVADN